jgi:arylsulfatase A-like enzyme
MEFVPIIDGIPQSLDESVDLLPEWLSDAGFSTALATASPIINPDRETARGFDTVFHENGLSGARLIEASTAQLEDLVDGDDRWFLSLHLFDPHIPYAPPEEFLTELDDLSPVDWDLGTTEGFSLMMDDWLQLEDETRGLVLQHLAVRYDGEVAYTDSILSSFWQGAESLGALDDTLVVLLSDHGEQFQDHERWTHGGTIFLEETSAITGFWHKDLAPLAWSGLTTHADLAPTMLEVLGLERPAVVSGDIVGAAEPERPVFTMRAVHITCPLQGVEQGDLRMLYNWDGGKRLYDTVSDPLERQNIYQSDSRDVRALWDLLEPQIRAFDPLIYDCTPQWIGP